MLRFPVKKIRKQFRLLLLLVLLMFAVWFTYLHVNQGKVKLHLNYGKDGEKQTEGTDALGRRSSLSSLSRHTDDDASDSLEAYPPEGEPHALGEESKDGRKIRKSLHQKPNRLPWKPEYKGQANLHVFEDWCGSSVAQLRKNLHFPLYPHLRTTVKKLAVAPKWKNYGLRIFGFIHPFRDGDFQFAVASDDNSEFWLSSDEDPLNARLLVYVGKLGSEWTAPGEFSKFRSQSSKSVHLMCSKRYYFELLHKQDDKGSDHVEVGWRPFLPGLKYEVIDSSYISLYTDESGLKMDQVDHIPQTQASRSFGPQEARAARRHGADMLKPDPRDTFFRTPMIKPSRVMGMLPPCLYSPTYVVKDFPIARYQGLQFVYLSFVYPNDFTRLTHMEKENKCFYRESPIYLEKFGFYKYMKMDEEEDSRPYFIPDPEDFLEEEEEEWEEEETDPEEEGPPVDTRPVRGRSNTSLAGSTFRPTLNTVTPTATVRPGMGGSVLPQLGERLAGQMGSRERLNGAPQDEPPNGLREDREAPEIRDPGVLQGRSISWVRIGPDGPGGKGGAETPFGQRSSLPALNGRAKELLRDFAPVAAASLPRTGIKHRKDEGKVYITRPRPSHHRRALVPRQPREVFPGVFLYQHGKTTKVINLNSRLRRRMGLRSTPRLRPKSALGHSKTSLLSDSVAQKAANRKAFARVSIMRSHQRIREPRVGRKEAPASRGGNVTFTSLVRETTPTTLPDHKTPDLVSPKGPLPTATSYDPTSEATEGQDLEEEDGDVSDYSYEGAGPRPGWAEQAIDWRRTFTVTGVDFELLRSDWNDLRCNVSGNLQLGESEAVDVLAQYMEKLNERNGGIYTLLRIINVEKRRDSARGSRYLVELELMERGRRVVRLSEYIYLLQHPRQRGGGEEEDGTEPGPAPSLAPSHAPTWSTAPTAPLLCQPAELAWRRDVTVHFVVPVKNQARWVRQFISDMELLRRETRDDGFSVVLVDFQSEDMDVEQALRESKVPSYKYLRREGNFERSAGLQMGVDTITDSQSIVFLCDLHIHFPLNILESIRKHCVEGRLAFAPIVMRLSCGSSPREPDGYWEVNGFGLFGIYKSDFDRVGGMNTEEFKDRWGGEDWELLDRVLQSGLEVERLRLRNFFHYYHSKRGMWNAQVKKGPQG